MKKRTGKHQLNYEKGFEVEKIQIEKYQDLIKKVLDAQQIVILPKK